MKTHIPRLLIATGIALMPGMTRAQQLTDGLLNYWDFEDNAEDTASDYPGSTGTTDNDGQINGIVTFSPGQSAGFGQAGNFPGGAGNNITVADPDGGTNDIDRSGASVTISAWFLLNNRDTGWQALIAHGEGNDYRIALQGTNNPMPITYNGAGNGTDIASTSTLGAGPAGDATWHHLVAVTDGTTTRLYLDGILEVSGGGGTINENGQNLLCIGCNPTNGREWNGMIDDVAMWDRPLSQEEVSQIYDTGLAGNDLSTLLVGGDDDSDGLPNGWEISYGLDPNDDGTVDINNGPAGDPDMDNLSNIDEFNNGTDPTKEDTDGDTLNDDIETDTGTWISAADTGTDPLKVDSDNDGLNDNVEDNGGVFVSDTMTGSDPNTDQSDTDTMPDGYEVVNSLDPNVDDSTGDPDMDTLSNSDEFGLGTDPQDDDSDDDFLRDDYETNDAVYDSPTDTGTDPLNPDTDGDGLLDGHETNNGEDSFVSPTDTGTNPHIVDTDGDGTHDAAEVVGPRDPTVADGVESGLGKKLLAYWNFDNNLDDIAHSLPGESMVADSGAFTGPETDVLYAAEGLFGPSALEQNGGAGWVTVPSSLDTLRGLDNAISVSTWVKVNSLDVNWQTIISHGEGAQWRIARRGGEPTPSWAGGATDLPGASVGPAIDDLGWHHVVGVSDPVLGVTAIYVDGVEIATGGAPNLSDTSNGGLTTDLFIGANPNAPNREWNGQIDDLAIWGRGLTQEEVTEIFEAGISLGDLLGGGTGLQITDISFDPSGGANGQFSITFTSRQNASYALYMSTDLIDFGADVDDDITGEDGSTTVIFAHPDPGNSRLFFRVEPN